MAALIGLAPGTTELLDMARRQPLQLADLLPLRTELLAANQRPLYQSGPAAQAIKRPAMHIMLNVWGQFKLRYLQALALRVVGDLLRFSGPAALEAIVGWLSDPDQVRPAQSATAAPVTAVYGSLTRYPRRPR
jgi:hypothetical protein